MIRAVLDTNIIIDALTGNREECESIISHFNSGKYKTLFSQELIGELMYVTKKIANQEFRDDDTKLSFIHNIADMFFYSKSINTLKISGKLEMYCNDKFDDMLLECSFVGKAHYLVTNDARSGLLDIDHYDFKVVTSEEFLQIILSE